MHILARPSSRNEQRKGCKPEVLTSERWHMKAWQLTEPCREAHGQHAAAAWGIPTVLYSQAAAKATYAHRRRQPEYTTVFPPLPSGTWLDQATHPLATPACHPSARGASTEFPRGASPSTPSTLSFKTFEFENTIVKVFIDWVECRIQCLPPNVASEIGLDLWLYDLRRKPAPTSEQEIALKKRILHLANRSPLGLQEAIENRTFKSLLGNGFEWIQCPTNW